MTPQAEAAQVIDFFSSNAGTGAAYKPLHPEFLGNSRHLSVQTEQALEQRLGELSALQKYASRYGAEDLAPPLAAALKARGWTESMLGGEETVLSRQCTARKKAIYTLQAHTLVRVSEDAMSTWVAHQMMDSPQSREALSKHMKDTRPLELQITRNQLAKLQTELQRQPGGASREQAAYYDELALRAGVLESQITDLNEVPTHERSLELSTDVSDRYLARRYEPYRAALHDLRNQTDRAVSLAARSNKPEVHELQGFRKQVDEMIENMYRAEKQRTEGMVEQAMASKTPLVMDYLPEVASSLIGLAASHRQGATARPPAETGDVAVARHRLAAAREHHRQADQAFAQQRAVWEQTRMPINDQVINNANQSLAELKRIEQQYGPVVAHADQTRQSSIDFSSQSAHKQQFCENTLYSMLDSKVEQTMNYGFISLSSAPPPILVGEQAVLIHKHYTSQLQQLRQDQQRNTADAMRLRQQAQHSGQSVAVHTRQLQDLYEAKTNNTSKISALEKKVEFLDRQMQPVLRSRSK